MPEVYTHGHHESVLRSHKWRTAENSCAYLLPHLAPDARLLDIGCGPGTITAGLADRVPQGHVTGIDAAPEIVEQAREAAGGRPNIDFAVGDVYALDYPDDSFDVDRARRDSGVLDRSCHECRAVRIGGAEAVDRRDRSESIGDTTHQSQRPFVHLRGRKQ